MPFIVQPREGPGITFKKPFGEGLLVGAIEVRCAKVREKTGAASLADLVRLSTAGRGPGPARFSPAPR